MNEPLPIGAASVDDESCGHTDGVPDINGVGEPGEVIPIPIWASGLSADRIGPIQWRPVAALTPYAPRFIEIPSFRGAPSWEMLRQLLQESGVRDPLLVLPDGRVMDGVHRLELGGCWAWRRSRSGSSTWPSRARTAIACSSRPRGRPSMPAGGASTPRISGGWCSS